MTLLIVDDEFYSVENLRNKLDWESLGFQRVLCAYSMAQAQEIFGREKVDVLLCDIEMPQGSGLDLLKWMREKEFTTVCIFLTCYAEFGYASEALHLGSSDYLLKPVEREELLEAVGRAAERVQQQEAARLNALYAGYWASSAVQMADQFWFRLVTGRISPTHAVISDQLQRHHLPASLMKERFFPVLLECLPTKELSRWESELYEFAVKNILRELLLLDDPQPEYAQDPASGAIITLDRQQYLILPVSAGNKPGILKRCERALSSCTEFLPGIFRFFLDGECTIAQIAVSREALVQAAKENIAHKHAVVDISAARAAPDGALTPVPAEHWSDLLLERREKELYQEVKIYLGRLSVQAQTRRRDLTHFYHDFSQVLYTQLEHSGAAAHKLFAYPQLESLSERACDSIQNMLEWVAAILDAYMDHIDSVRRDGTVIEEIRKYIREHLADELNRNDLASAVYLSPDYLSHLFSEKTGMSLTAYITNERIRRAKELLLQDKLSIRDIALMSGFQNISYFSKQFKRIVGLTPQEFRKKGLKS